ncbi:sporulation protein YunB [Niameybacter massiliensis]|uniref:sporulation protein YunB n=1 Tax=Niameybacter massiliensis TaxID=1658108 RepID=UPI0006B54372|nr:sporulation protein YunB [Niameybacter massiliensis]
MFRNYKYRYRPTPKPKHYAYSSPYVKSNQSHNIKGAFALLLIIAIFAVIYIQLDREVMPTVIAMAEKEATTISTKAINEAVNLSLESSQVTEEDLISYDYNDAGELVSWNVNSILINTLCADIVDKVAEKLATIGTISFKVPLGNLTGSRIFANLGPELSIQVLPIGTVKVDYDNQIRSTGINQVNHTVWLDVDTTVQVVVPLFSDQVHISRRIVLIDKMVSGKVPPSYVNVLPSNVLDVAPGEVSEQFDIYAEP